MAAYRRHLRRGRRRLLRLPWPHQGQAQGQRHLGSPAEVEPGCWRTPSAQAVVVAANDTDGLEKPVAFVQLNPGGQADEETLIAFCRLGLPSFSGRAGSCS